MPFECKFSSMNYYIYFSISYSFLQNKLISIIWRNNNIDSIFRLILICILVVIHNSKWDIFLSQILHNGSAVYLDNRRMRVVSVRYKCIHLGVIRMTFKDVSLRDIGWLTCETTFRRHTGKQLNSWPARWRTFPENSKEAGPFFHIYICLQSTLGQLFLPSCTRMGKRLPYPSSVYHPYIHFFPHSRNFPSVICCGHLLSKDPFRLLRSSVGLLCPIHSFRLFDKWTFFSFMRVFNGGVSKRCKRSFSPYTDRKSE